MRDTSLGFAVLPTGVARSSGSHFASNALGDGAQSSAQANFTLWDAASGVFVGTIKRDPMLWDAPGGDGSIRRASLCIDRGHPIAPLGGDGPRRDTCAVGFDVNYAPASQV